MEYKKIEFPGYNLHIISTDKFKTVHMEMTFRSVANKEKMPLRTMLVDYLTDSCLKYPNRLAFSRKLEELYDAVIYGNTNKTGNIFNSSFIMEFVSDKYIKEKNYLNEVINFFFNVIFEPNIVDKKLDEAYFKIIKDKTLNEIKELEENPVKKAIKKALKYACDDSTTTYSIVGNKEQINAATAEEMLKIYKEMLENDLCDIYIIGDVDTSKVSQIIDKYIKIRTIKVKEIPLYVENTPRYRKLVMQDKDDFHQTSLNIIYNIDKLSEFERHIVFNVYNYILGSGGLTSKLYKNVREKNSLCYSINSLYLKYDRLLLIQVSLDEVNKAKAIKIILKSVKEMVSGKVTLEDLEDAKNNLISNLDMSLDNPGAILNRYIFNTLDNLPTVEQTQKLLKEVTLKDIKNVAQKLRLNTIYSLIGDENGKEGN